MPISPEFARSRHSKSWLHGKLCLCSPSGGPSFIINNKNQLPERWLTMTRVLLLTNKKNCVVTVALTGRMGAGGGSLPGQRSVVGLDALIRDARLMGAFAGGGEKRKEKKDGRVWGEKTGTIPKSPVPRLSTSYTVYTTATSIVPLYRISDLHVQTVVALLLMISKFLQNEGDDTMMKEGQFGDRSARDKKVVCLASRRPPLPPEAPAL